MRLLILGGTLFLGRHLVEAALAGGHEVTLFNRGQHNPTLYPELEKLRGDRDGNLEALRGRRWDAVIDTCGYVPRVVQASAELLAGAVDHYTFISSISVYRGFSTSGMDEDALVGTLPDGTVEEVTGETYGPLKALCEQAAERAMPGRVLNVRAGLIVGPHDPTDRFTYWPQRVAQGGDVLAPGDPGRRVQFIDARDLAEWNVRMAQAGQAGTYNVTGPDHALTMGALLEQCKATSGSDARFVWVSDRFLLEERVTPWTELPLWIPADRTDMAGFLSVSCGRAIAAGLTFRPLADTVRDTLAWDDGRAGAPAPGAGSGAGVRGAGLAPGREAELLAAWRARS